MKQRILCWYSRGTASLVAAKLTIDKYYNDSQYDVQVVCIYIESEYHDESFDAWASMFLGVPITYIKDEKYNASVDVVIEKTKYMSGVNGARCTTELKKNVRKAYQKYDDLHVFGMDSNESHRINRILDAEPDLQILTPLIDLKMSKEDCFTFLKQFKSYKVQKMYELGYKNNNCIGCVKSSGAGYWNKIRKDFPEVFARRSRQEYLLNVAMVTVSEKKMKKKYPHIIERMIADNYKIVVKENGQMRVPLRYLPSDLGNKKDLNTGDCGFFCEVK